MADSSSVDIDHLRKWIGRIEEKSDQITPHLVAALRATLFGEPGSPAHGDIAPTTVHWCLTPPVAAMSQLGPDGHPARGGFLPPVRLPRRMWAGGRLELLDALRVGDEVKRISRITDVALKSGSTGALCFVTVEHQFTTARGPAVRERHDIVYRDIATTGAASPAPNPKPSRPAQHHRALVADPVLLFRYSALTFNGHRIHYDRLYVTEVEFYPGLIVHGPLQMSLLIDYAASLRGKPPTEVDYRGVRPLFDGPFSLNANAAADGNSLELWTADPSGSPTMTASARW
jgi:3-methylfumaryl-CoA hydratase